VTRAIQRLVLDWDAWVSTYVESSVLLGLGTEFRRAFASSPDSVLYTTEVSDGTEDGLSASIGFFVPRYTLGRFPLRAARHMGI